MTVPAPVVDAPARRAVSVPVALRTGFVAGLATRRSRTDTVVMP